MSGEGQPGQPGPNGSQMPMPGDIPMPTQEETDKMFKELMKMQFDMNADEFNSDKEDNEEGKEKDDSTAKKEAAEKPEASKD